jgi:hypothetical protein
MGDLVTFVTEKYRGGFGRYPYLSFKGLQDDGRLQLENGRVDGVLAEPGDTVFTRQGHQRGWVAKKVSLVISQPLIAANTLLVIRPLIDIDPVYLNLFLRAPSTKQVISDLHGERTSANLSILRSLKVRLPELPAQHQVVAAFKHLTAYQSQLFDTYVSVDTFAKSVMDDLFEIDPDGT